jgi:hypothetical protein
MEAFLSLSLSLSLFLPWNAFTASIASLTQEHPKHFCTSKQDKVKRKGRMRLDVKEDELYRWGSQTTITDKKEEQKNRGSLKRKRIKIRCKDLSEASFLLSLDSIHMNRRKE